MLTQASVIPSTVCQFVMLCSGAALLLCRIIHHQQFTTPDVSCLHQKWRPVRSWREGPTLLLDAQAEVRLIEQSHQLQALPDQLTSHRSQISKLSHRKTHTMSAQQVRLMLLAADDRLPINGPRASPGQIHILPPSDAQARSF